MWKIAAVAALLLVGVYGQDKTRCSKFCTANGQKEGTCDVAQCDFTLVTPTCSASARKAVNSYSLMESGKLCTCAATGECTEVGNPNCATKEGFKEHSECNGGNDNYLDQFCFPNEAGKAKSPTLDDAGDAKYVSCKRGTSDGSCFAGYCLTPAEITTASAPFLSGEEPEFSIQITSPALISVNLWNNIPTIVLSRSNPVFDAKLPAVTGWSYGITGPSTGNPAITYITKNEGSNGFKVTVNPPAGTDNHVFLTYAVPYIKIGAVELLNDEEIIVIAVLPALKVPTARTTPTAPIWKSGVSVSTATPPSTTGDTKIALGHYITLEGMQCAAYTYAGFVLRKTASGADEVEEYWEVENFAEIKEFQFVRTDIDPNTKVVLIPACFSVYGEKLTHATISQTWTVDARPTTKIASTSTTLTRADFAIFAYQLKNPPHTYTLTEIIAIQGKLVEHFGLRSSPPTNFPVDLPVYKEPTAYFTTFDQLKQKKLTILAQQIIIALASFETDVECISSEILFLLDIQAMVDLGDPTSSDNDVLGEYVETSQTDFVEACFETENIEEEKVVAENNKFGVRQVKKKKKSAAAKARSTAMTPAERTKANKDRRKNDLLVYKNTIEKELREQLATLTPGTVVQLTSKDPVTHAPTPCWQACAVRNPAVKPKEKLHTICSIGTGTKDELKLRGDEKKINENTAANKAKFPADAIVGLLKFHGTNPACNFEKSSNSKLVSAGSYHVFVFDVKALGVKGAPKTMKPKSLALPVLSAAKHVASRKFSSEQTSNHVSTQKFGIAQTASWDFVVTPAEYSPNNVACQVRNKKGDLTAAFAGTTTAADGNGCVLGNDANIGVESSLVLLPKSALTPSKPATPVTFKSAAKTSICTALLLVLAVLAMML
jgi:hypothetical protein